MQEKKELSFSKLYKIFVYVALLALAEIGRASCRERV